LMLMSFSPGRSVNFRA